MQISGAQIDLEIAKRVRKYVDSGKFGIADHEPDAIKAIRDIIISKCERGEATYYSDILSSDLRFRNEKIQHELRAGGDRRSSLLGYLLGRMTCDSYLETGVFLSAVILGSGHNKVDGFGNLMRALGKEVILRWIKQ